MSQLFSDLPEAIENTVVLAKRCAFMVEEKKPMLPQARGVVNTVNETILIKDLCAKGLMKRLEIDQVPESP